MDPDADDVDDAGWTLVYGHQDTGDADWAWRDVTVHVSLTDELAVAAVEQLAWDDDRFEELEPDDEVGRRGFAFHDDETDARFELWCEDGELTVVLPCAIPSRLLAVTHARIAELVASLDLDVDEATLRADWELANARALETAIEHGFHPTTVSDATYARVMDWNARLGARRDALSGFTAEVTVYAQRLAVIDGEVTTLGYLALGAGAGQFVPRAGHVLLLSDDDDNPTAHAQVVRWDDLVSQVPELGAATEPFAFSDDYTEPDDSDALHGVYLTSIRNRVRPKQLAAATSTTVLALDEVHTVDELAARRGDRAVIASVNFDVPVRREVVLEVTALTSAIADLGLRVDITADARFDGRERYLPVRVHAYGAWICTGITMFTAVVDAGEPPLVDGEHARFTVWARNTVLPADDNEIALAWFVAAAIARLGNGSVFPLADDDPCDGSALAEALVRRARSFRRTDAYAHYDYALFLAVEDDDLARLRARLDAGGSLDARDSWGNTPLLAALSAKRHAVARELLARGAAVDATNRAGKSVAHAAEICGDVALRTEILARTGVPAASGRRIITVA